MVKYLSLLSVPEMKTERGEKSLSPANTTCFTGHVREGKEQIKDGG
jgi:hypothetical protein